MRKILKKDQLPFALAFASILLVVVTQFINVRPADFGLTQLTFEPQSLMGRVLAAINVLHPRVVRDAWDFGYMLDGQFAGWVLLGLGIVIVSAIVNYSNSIPKNMSESSTNELIFVDAKAVSYLGEDIVLVRMFQFPRWKLLIYLLPCSWSALWLSTCFSFRIPVVDKPPAIDIFVLSLLVLLPIELGRIGYLFGTKYFPGLKLIRKLEINVHPVESREEKWFFYFALLLAGVSFLFGPTVVGPAVFSTLGLAIVVGATFLLGSIYRYIWLGLIVLLGAFFPALRTWR